MSAAQISVLLADTPTADEVKPGWVALLIVFLMGVALALLMWSMVRQFRKVDFPEDTDESPDGASEVAGRDDEHETNGSATSS